jgi:colanic acid biosynthesis glycosyl transferase WcaI
MRIQLWSYNYAPEPTGIAPVCRVFAEGMAVRGHHVEVVAAHPHYPEPRWGKRRLPYREVRDGIPVLRLPLWVGRATTGERYRQELSFTASQFAALPFLGRPDVIVSASPSFPALMPAILYTRMRRIPWMLWIHDLLPDGAVSTGLVEESRMIRAARRLERAAYRHADGIVVLSRAFETNLLAKGVDPAKLELIYNPTTRIPSQRRNGRRDGPLRVLSMGNIGLSQGLAPVVEAIEGSPELDGKQVQLRIAGTGVAAPEVRAAAKSDRVEMLGLVDDDVLEAELLDADVAIVTQRHGGVEFNLPSKMMTFMAYGLPVLGVVDPDGEVAQLVADADAGWIVDSSTPERWPAKLAELADSRDEVHAKGEASRAYAERRFLPDTVGDQFEAVLEQIARTTSR